METADISSSTIQQLFILLNMKNISKLDPDPVGSGLHWVNRIGIWILKTGFVDPDPDPKKMDQIRNTAILVNLCF